MNIRGLAFSFAVFLAAFSATPSFLFAQFGAISEPLEMVLEPERPAPFSPLTITLESLVTDLSASEIVWLLNDEVVLEGMGERRLSITTGGAGVLIKIIALVQTESGQPIRKELLLNPAGVALLWQSDGYVPPFYRGKALVPYQGGGMIAALPSFASAEGRPFAPQELIYTWKEGDEVIEDGSGVGKSTFFFQSRVPIRPAAVSVLVTSPDKTLVAESRISVAPQAPRLLLYENHPLYGIRFEKSSNENFFLSSDEIRLSAIPFYVETKNRSDSLLRYNWSLNFSGLPNEKKADLILRRSSEKGGQAELSLEIQHTAKGKLFQGARALTTIFMEDRISGSF